MMNTNNVPGTRCQAPCPWHSSLELILTICYPVAGKSVFSGSQAAVFRGILRMIPLLILTLHSSGFTEDPEGRPLFLPTQDGMIDFDQMERGAQFTDLF